MGLEAFDKRRERIAAAEVEERGFVLGERLRRMHSIAITLMFEVGDSFNLSGFRISDEDGFPKVILSVSFLGIQIFFSHKLMDFK